jgi:hypothetical protein
MFGIGRKYLWMVMIAGLACLAVGVQAPATPGAGPSPPNWKGGGTGTTRPDGIFDDDAFSGKSSHLGQFTGQGFHLLNPENFTFAGQATWTASNGDTLDVTYEGQIFFSGDPDFPFGFDAELQAIGGNGHFSGAQGNAAMSGAFTGIPGEFYFNFEGTLQSDAK